ncbi:transcriptional regulator, GntR family [Granulicatella balaenopterae]|uniref:Transcriptional regulator, GntR family n=1 Tax=Granulicatella balaenopterae TaxID=137733 RepID=A0A1H9NX87_9LACT|nr:GntR family transcriptional regulator [Granulicatella balaenopterae]SER40407.1 transcriptional regulator, GntR family [Granulicatella balaenopterae]
MIPKDIVYKFISEEVTKGNLKKGDRLIETTIAEHIGLSRTPVREALLELSATGIVERMPNKGFTLKNYTVTEMREIYQLIGVLDGKVAELTCDLLDEEDYANMNFLISSMYAAISNKLYTKYNELQEEFHNVYIQKCPNKTIAKELDNRKKFFIGKAFLYTNPELIQSILNETNDEHTVILNLFKANKKHDVRHYLEDVHWAPDKSTFDQW